MVVRLPRAVVFGCSGPRLTEDERRFFAAADPLGFILFAHNCAAPDQVRRLIGELRAAVGRADAPVLIDQEGGRVQRLRPPRWRRAPAPAAFGRLAATDSERARAAARLNARLIAAELAELGITVDCAPVVDVPQPGADPIIGDRAFGPTAEAAAVLGRAFCDGLLDGGVLPVVKHIPGHGRAAVDSHKGLPRVAADRADLEETDFRPFRELADMPWAMTAHVVYEAIDPDRPATTSARVVAEVIRGRIGFDGVLISDDLAMGALEGSLPERAAAALAAGCDVVLHCNTERAGLDVLEAVAEACPPLGPATADRLARAEESRRAGRPLDRAGAEAILAKLMAEAA